MNYDKTLGAGGTFITDIAPSGSGTVSNKVFEDGIVLVSCDTDATSLVVSVLSFTGLTHLIPRVTVNGVSVTNFVLNADKRYAGSAVIPIGTGTVTVAVAHEDGGYYESTVTVISGPTLTDLRFTGSYPGAQTELKSGDTFGITFTADMSIDYVEVYNFEAAQFYTGALTPGAGPFNMNVTIAGRGAGTFANQRVRVRCRGSNGIWGAAYTSDAFGSGDASAYVQLNNDVPVVSIGAITYPASQGALKDSETATVANTVTFPSGVGTVLYSSPNSDLSVANTTTYETSKTVTRIAGNYNISTNNFRIVATKTTNAATTTSNAIVKIAHVAATLAITEPAARLRSGGNAGTSAQNHVITITASQQLYAAPTLVAPVGAWQGGAFAGGPTAWTRSLQIHDNDTKGTHAWGAISGTNLAGIVTTAITGDGNYTVGGFVFRTFYVAAWPNREASIGTRVSDTSKLRCTNLSKGTTGTLNFTFMSSVADQVDMYTITDPSSVYNASGNLWRNNDLGNAVSNTTGLLQIELEELA